MSGSEAVSSRRGTAGGGGNGTAGGATGACATGGGGTGACATGGATGGGGTGDGGTGDGGGKAIWGGAAGYTADGAVGPVGICPCPRGRSP